MKFTKYNNPNKRKTKRKMNRLDADIIACNQMMEDLKNGIEMPLKHYDKISDQLCGKQSREIYK